MEALDVTKADKRLWGGVLGWGGGKVDGADVLMVLMVLQHGLVHLDTYLLSGIMSHLSVSMEKAKQTCSRMLEKGRADMSITCASTHTHTDTPAPWLTPPHKCNYTHFRFWGVKACVCVDRRVFQCGKLSDTEQTTARGFALPSFCSGVLAR